MSQRTEKIIRISAFILTMAMLVLYSAGTILMTLPKEKAGERQVQFGTSGSSYAHIKKFEFVNSKIKSGDKVEAEIEINFTKSTAEGVVEDDSYDIDTFELTLFNMSTFESYTLTQTGRNYNTYTFTPDRKLAAGNYKITVLTLYSSVRRNGNTYSGFLTRFYASYCNTTEQCEAYKYLQKTFAVEYENPADKIPVYEYTIGFQTTDPEVSVGISMPINIKRIDRVDEVKLERKELKSMMLSFTNESDGNVVNMYVKWVSASPFIVIPSTATPGKYNLDFGYLTFTDNTSAKYQNTDTKTFAYNSSFIVKDKQADTSKYYFDNISYGTEIAEALDRLDDDAIITVNANSLPVISEDVFKSIQNTKQTLIIEYERSQWVFSGTDIKNPKSIDVSMVFEKLTTSSEYYDSFLKENTLGPSAILKFSDNGDLPGKVLIKMDRESVDGVLEKPNTVHVYYYKEDSDKLSKVAMEIQPNANFYEFYINHNSKYILTTQEVAEEVVDEDIDMLSLNHQLVIQQQQQQLPITYILATVCGVLAIGLLGSLLGKKKQQTQKQGQQG